MSSIAYITDHQMIEFHRLHGNTSFVFWRPTSQKRFAKFAYGDYLFFLAKGNNKGKGREKGIVGYGRYTKDYAVNFDSMWKRFKTKTGYPTKEHLHEAILKVSKSHTLPDNIHCLQLDDVVFFQTPIYLSEFHVQLSKQVESYIYLDQEDIFVSSRIIQKAASFGKDMWSTMVLKHDKQFQYDADIIVIQNLYEKLNEPNYSEYEKSKLYQFAKSYMVNKNCRFLPHSYNDFLSVEEEHAVFYIPCLSSLQSFMRNLQYSVGRYELYEGAIAEMKSKAQVYLLFDQDISENIKSILDAKQVRYIIHKS